MVSPEQCGYPLSPIRRCCGCTARTNGDDRNSVFHRAGWDRRHLYSGEFKLQGQRQPAGQRKRKVGLRVLAEAAPGRVRRFGSEVNATFAALRDDSRLFGPSDPPPTFEDFKKADRDQPNHFEKMSLAAVNLGLVASQDVCDAANREWAALIDASDQHVSAARPYVTGQKPPDDDYRKIWITYTHLEVLQNMFKDFVIAAREDLTDLALRGPAKNC